MQLGVEGLWMTRLPSALALGTLVVAEVAKDSTDRQQQQHRRCHNQQHTRPQSTAPVRFNQDFPHYNVRGVCIRCGSGWLPGYWRRQARYGPPSNRAYDPLADKIICDSCRSAHPLGPFCFPEYYTYVTDDAVRRVQAEADTASPAAETAARCKSLQLS